MITPADQVPDWEPARAGELLSECGEVTVTEGNTTITLYISEVAGVAGDGCATVATTGEGYGLGGFAIASATVAVGPNLVQFIGIAPELDEAEFVRLANAAVDRARAEL